MSLKFVTVNDNVFQLLGDVPQTPYRRAAPGPCWGTSPRLCSSKIPLKIPCWDPCIAGKWHAVG